MEMIDYTILEKEILRHGLWKIMYSKVLELKPKTVLELGVGEGWSTRTLLYALSKIDGKLISVDTCYCYKAKQAVDELGLGSRWQFIQFDDLFLDLNDKYKLIFLDTSHTYNHTYAELKKYTKLLEPGGQMLLHDIHFDGVNPPDLNVKEAVRIFLAENSGWNFIDLLPLDTYGMGLLWKDA